MLRLLLLPLIAGVVLAEEQDSARPNYKPSGGYVPDEQTAVAIAVAVWTPIYGKENIDKQKPYTAELKDGVWHVRGTLQQPLIGRKTGGVAEAEISKDDGRVLRIIHDK